MFLLISSLFYGTLRDKSSFNDAMLLEQRLSFRMTKYWNNLKGDKEIPAIELFNNALIQDIWPNCIQIAVFKSNDTLSYSYEYIGDEIGPILGKIRLGDRMTSKMTYLPTVKILSSLDTAVSKPETVIEDGQFVNPVISKVVKYRSCLLPFGKNRDHITHFIVGFSWRTY